MQIKTTLRYHLTQVRMARTQTTMNAGEDMGKELLYTTDDNVN
jgi:hypothetical protein